MKAYLDNIRKPDNSLSLKEKIIKMILIFILGILLGMFSKWLDNLSIDSTIWWQHLIEILDLNNFFSEISIWLGIALVISILS